MMLPLKLLEHFPISSFIPFPSLVGVCVLRNTKHISPHQTQSSIKLYSYNAVSSETFRDACPKEFL